MYNFQVSFRKENVQFHFHYKLHLISYLNSHLNCTHMCFLFYFIFLSDLQFDHDPRQPAYIATQGPLAHTVADFWQVR